MQNVPCRLKGCAKCGGDLIFREDEWGCIQCGTYYYPLQPAPRAKTDRRVGARPPGTEDVKAWIKKNKEVILRIRTGESTGRQTNYVSRIKNKYEEILQQNGEEWISAILRQDMQG